MVNRTVNQKCGQPTGQPAGSTDRFTNSELRFLMRIKEIFRKPDPLDSCPRLPLPDRVGRLPAIRLSDIRYQILAGDGQTASIQDQGVTAKTNNRNEMKGDSSMRKSIPACPPPPRSKVRAPKGLDRLPPRVRAKVKLIQAELTFKACR